MQVTTFGEDGSLVTTDVKDEPKKKAASEGYEPNKDESTPDSATGGDEGGDNKPDLDPDNKVDDKAAKKPEKKPAKKPTDVELERDHWRQVAGDLAKGAKLDDDKGKKPDVTLKEPNPDDFDDMKDYYKALSKYEAVKTKEEVKKEILAEQKAEDDRKAQNRVISKWQEAMEEARTRYPDFDEVTDTNLALDKDGIIQETFLTSPIGVDICYWYGNNPDEAKRLLKLTPVALARELGKIEAKLQVELDAGKDKGKKTVTETNTKPKPKPVTPLEGGKGKVPVDLSDEDMPYQEWKALRNKQIRDRRN